MDWGKLTEDQLDELIVRAEGEVASWRAVQMAAVGEKAIAWLPSCGWAPVDCRMGGGAGRCVAGDGPSYLLDRLSSSGGSRGGRAVGFG